MALVEELFKSFEKLGFYSHYEHQKASKVDSNKNQGIVNIMKLMPLDAFDDGIEGSAFILNPNLLSKFLGVELGGFISAISNDFDFGFDSF